MGVRKRISEYRFAKSNSGFFSVTVDELLSTREVLAIAEDDRRRTKKHFRDLVYGLLDISVLLFFFLPVFAVRCGGDVTEASLFALGELPIYLKATYFTLVIFTIIYGIVTLSLQNYTNSLWLKLKTNISLALGIVSVLLFTVSAQPYAAAFIFFVLIMKVVVLIKHS